MNRSSPNREHNHVVSDSGAPLVYDSPLKTAKTSSND